MSKGETRIQHQWRLLLSAPFISLQLRLAPPLPLHHFLRLLVLISYDHRSAAIPGALAVVSPSPSSLAGLLTPSPLPLLRLLCLLSPIQSVFSNVYTQFMPNLENDTIPFWILQIRCSVDEPLKVMISGAPASGKGTQCELIVQKVNIPLILSVSCFVWRLSVYFH